MSRNTNGRVDEHFGMALASMMGDSRLTPSARLVYCAISLQCQGCDSVRLSLKALIPFTGLGDTAIRTAQSLLIETGWLEIDYSTSGHAAKYSPSRQGGVSSPTYPRLVSQNEPLPVANLGGSHRLQGGVSSLAESEGAPIRERVRRVREEEEGDLPSLDPDPVDQILSSLSDRLEERIKDLSLRDSGVPETPSQRLRFSFTEIIYGIDPSEMPGSEKFLRLYDQIRDHCTLPDGSPDYDGGHCPICPPGKDHGCQGLWLPANGTRGWEKFDDC